MIDRRAGGFGRTAALTAMALLSFGPIIVKDTDLEAITFAHWRLVTAVALYLVLLYAMGGRVTVRSLRLSAVGGLFFALNISFFFMAVKNTSTANAVVISALQPAVMLGVIGPLLGERPRRSIYLWTALAIGGVALSVFAGGETGGQSLSGDVWAMGAAVMFALFYTASKQARAHLDTLEYQFGLTLTASVAMVPILLFSGQSTAVPEAGAWIPIVLMALIPGTGHVLTAYAFRSVSLTLMSLITLATPVLSSLYAWWLIDEEVGALQALGILLVVVCLGVVVTRPAQGLTSGR